MTELNEEHRYKVGSAEAIFTTHSNVYDEAFMQMS